MSLVEKLYSFEIVYPFLVIQHRKYSGCLQSERAFIITGDRRFWILHCACKKLQFLSQYFLHTDFLMRFFVSFRSSDGFKFEKLKPLHNLWRAMMMMKRKAEPTKKYKEFQWIYIHIYWIQTLNSYLLVNAIFFRTFFSLVLFIYVLFYTLKPKKNLYKYYMAFSIYIIRIEFEKLKGKTREREGGGESEQKKKYKCEQFFFYFIFPNFSLGFIFHWTSTNTRAMCWWWQLCCELKYLIWAKSHYTIHDRVIVCMPV